MRNPMYRRTETEIIGKISNNDNQTKQMTPERKPVKPKPAIRTQVVHY